MRSSFCLFIYRHRSPIEEIRYLVEIRFFSTRWGNFCPRSGKRRFSNSLLEFPFDILVCMVANGLIWVLMQIEISPGVWHDLLCLDLWRDIFEILGILIPVNSHGFGFG